MLTKWPVDMRIVLLTSVYPSKNSPKGTTPVIHYFAKEWVKSGHDVHVFHIESLFPFFYYWAGRLFKKPLETRLGHLIPNKKPTAYYEDKDGVKVSHLILKKNKPHSHFSESQLQYIVDQIALIIDTDGVPDCFVGHWDNPQLELLYRLKTRFDRPSCLVFHCNHFNRLLREYNDTDLMRMLSSLDTIGFRNATAQANFIKLFGEPTRSFIAASGVSNSFIEAGISSFRLFDIANRFVYVGSLIGRKEPLSVMESLVDVYKEAWFSMTYIGEGEERKKIERFYASHKCGGELVFTGRIPRDEVISYLKQSDIFIMISRGEIFGLVYLEAMALGCIPVASKGEGIDGIIKDGVNGFLCEAGNTTELSTILRKIRCMGKDELTEMSVKAMETAREYSDVNVAERYIDELSAISKKAN